jgi:dihydrofolate reductase
LPAAAREGVTSTAADPGETVAALKTQPGRDIWLFGGGALFRSLLDAGMVDTVEIAVMPVLLGSGIPLMPPGSQIKLTLADRRVLPDSGIVILAYTVNGSTAQPPRIEYVNAGASGRIIGTESQE